MAQPRVVTVGDRIAMWRGLRGWSQRQLADFAGLSAGFIGMLESGQRQLSRRRDLYAIADALQCTPEDLTGEPFAPVDEPGVLAYAAIPALRVALIDGGPDYPPDVPARPLEQLAQVITWAGQKWEDARYETFGPRVPALIEELHVHAASSDEETSRQALTLLVEACYLAYGLAKALGHPELAMIASDKGLEAARRVEDPTLVAFAQWVQVVALERAGGRRRAPVMADAAIEAMEGHAGTDGEARQVYGMLHLIAGLLAARDGRPDASEEHLAEAAALAERTGEGNAYALHFGPTNAAMWRVGAAVELGQGPRAVEVARRIDPDVLDSPARAADFYLELGRALAQTDDGSRDPEALRMFLRAERLAAQKVQTDPLVRSIVVGMSRRDRAGRIDLRSFARRLRVAAE